MYILDDDKLNTIRDYFIADIFDSQIEQWGPSIEDVMDYFAFWPSKTTKETLIITVPMFGRFMGVEIEKGDKILYRTYNPSPYYYLHSLLQAHISETHENKAIDLKSGECDFLIEYYHFLEELTLHDLFKIMPFTILLEHVENVDFDKYEVSIKTNGPTASIELIDSHVENEESEEECSVNFKYHDEELIPNTDEVGANNSDFISILNQDNAKSRESKNPEGISFNPTEISQSSEVELKPQRIKAWAIIMAISGVLAFINILLLSYYYSIKGRFYKK
ncbi:hypothetical protein HZS_4485, partial [Henneguya salminicola]